MEDTNELFLFDIDKFTKYEDHWQDMPEFSHKDLTPLISVIVHFRNEQDMREFADIVGQKITVKTQSIWYPQAQIDRYMDKRYIDEPNI